jgi:hypothetical protein
MKHCQFKVDTVKVESNAVTRMQSGKVLKPRNREDAEYAAVLPLTEAGQSQAKRRVNWKTESIPQSGGQKDQEIYREFSFENVFDQQFQNTEEMRVENEDVSPANKMENAELMDIHNLAKEPYTHSKATIAESTNLVNTSKSLTSNPGILDVLRTGEPLLNFPKCLTEFYDKDSLFRAIKEDSGNYRNFSMTNGLIYLSENSGMKLCIPDTKIGKRKLREIIITQAHSLLAHLEQRKLWIIFERHSGGHSQ